jgi:hypothetical protein
MKKPPTFMDIDGYQRLVGVIVRELLAFGKRRSGRDSA